MCMFQLCMDFHLYRLLEEPSLADNFLSCLFIQLVLYDAVNRNNVSIRWLSFILFVTHYMFRPLRAIFRWDIQLDIFKDYI
jgi:hypothetical protein